MPQVDVQFGEFLATGNYQYALQHLTRSIAAICRADRGVTRFYIGKGSGPDSQFAIERRFDDKKVLWGLNEDWALFQSTSRNVISALETELNDTFMQDARCVNDGKGSAGRRSDQPHHFIYLALRRS